MNNQRISLRYDLRMSAGSEEAEIMVYGDIVSYKWGEDDPDVTARDFDTMVKNAKKAGAKRLTLRINSGGGYVYQAVAMRTMLLSAGFESIRVRVEGLCASAATLLCCVPGARVSIGEGAMFMVHNPQNGCWGNAQALEHCAQMLRKMEADVQNIYAAHTGKPAGEMKALMDKESWMTAQEAVDHGFCHEVIAGEGLAVACVSEDALCAMKRLYRHVPDSLAGQMKISTTPPSVADGSVTADNTTHNNDNEEEHSMAISDITMEQLHGENPGLYQQIMQEGARMERERISEIDDMTPVGFEDMAEEAKRSGTTPLAFCKQIVAAQRERSKARLDARRQETAPAAQVAGGSPQMNEGKTEKQEIEAYAREMAEMAKAGRFGGADGGMY